MPFHRFQPASRAKQLAFTVFIWLLALGLPLTSRAHGYWLDVKGPGKVGQPVRVQLCFGEIDDRSVRHRETGPELAQTGTFRVYVLDAQGHRTDLPLRALRDCWETTFTPQSPGTYQLLATTDALPVVDRSASGGESVRPIEYLCAAYVAGAGSAPPSPRQFLDIVAAPQGQLTRVAVFREGKPVASGTSLRVFNPENWEKTLTTDAQGTAAFRPTMPGLYIIRQDWFDPTPGTYQGVAYQRVRHRCDYCLWVR